MNRIFINFLLLLIFFASSALSATNSKPFVIPELREWIGGEGEFVIDKKTKIVLLSESDKLSDVVEAFVVDYDEMFKQRLKLQSGKYGDGDIVFQLISDSSLGKEGYIIEIGDAVIVKAATEMGLYWATRTLLQMSDKEQQGVLPQGTIKDYPDYAVRGFMIDCARTFIPMTYLEDYVKILAYYKMNTFQIHLNDNGLSKFFNDDWSKTYSAFRLESETFPGLTAEDGHYTKAEFIEFQLLAESMFVNIIPEIDVPAHSLAFVHYKPELESEYGTNYLDLYKPETYEFVDALFKEYLEGENPVFRGKQVHIGTDEYKVAITEDKVREKFRYFADRYIKYIESFDKQACLWGSFTAMYGETEIKSDNVIMNIWHNPYGHPSEMINDGYKIINIPESNYIVPTADYYNDYLDIKKIYNNWTPAHVADVVFEEKHEAILGGMFAVWNDRIGSGVSVKDIHDRTYPAVQVISAKTWSGANTTVSFDEFNERRFDVCEAPGVNLAGRIGSDSSLVYEQKILMPNSTSPYEEIGYNYTITFDLDGLEEELGTVLFKSEHAVFYLSDPIKGMLGFSRDGYLNTFRSSTYNKNGVRVKIQGDNRSTKLFINDILVDDLDISVRHFNNPKVKMDYISTLVFPLQKTGDFKSKITNLRVYNYLK